MSAEDLTKCAATLAAAACVFVMPSASAAGWNDDASTAYSTPASAPCHPSLLHGACLKHSRNVAGAVEIGATTVAELRDIYVDPVSAPCHPSADRGACLKRWQHAISQYDALIPLNCATQPGERT